MRVAVDAVGIREGGGAAILLELLRWLPIVRPTWHWHVFLLPPRQRDFADPPTSARMALESIRGSGGLSRLTWSQRRLRRAVRRVGGDVLLSLANIAPLRPVVPQAVFCQNVNPFRTEEMTNVSRVRRLRYRFMRSCILRSAAASDAVVVQTEVMRHILEDADRSLATKLHVIPCGFRSPSPAPQIRPDVKARIDTAPRPRLIYVAVVRHNKNHVALLRALPAIREAFPTATLLLTGDPSEGSETYATLVRETTALGLENAVRWLGRLTPGEVTYALSASDLLVFPSLAESFGLPLVEAMAAGCPIAAADLPYAREVCDDAAAYFPPHDPAGVARTVRDLLGDGRASERLKAAGARRRPCFEYRTIADRFATVIETISTRG